MLVLNDFYFGKLGLFGFLIRYKDFFFINLNVENLNLIVFESIYIYFSYDRNLFMRILK